MSTRCFKTQTCLVAVGDQKWGPPEDREGCRITHLMVCCQFEISHVPGCWVAAVFQFLLVNGEEDFAGKLCGRMVLSLGHLRQAESVGCCLTCSLQKAREEPLLPGASFGTRANVLESNV